MFRPLLDALRTEVSGARALESVRAIAAFHRIQATPGYDEAARWLAAQVRALGLEPELEDAPGDGESRRLGALMPEGWWCDEARATLIDGATRETLADWAEQPLSLVQRSDAVDGRFEVVDVGEGTEESHYQGREVRGRVVLAAGPVMRVHALAVEQRGAAGILTDTRRLVDPVRGPDTDPDAIAYTSFWWAEDQPRGWGFALSPRVGARLRERLRAGAPLALEARIVARRFPTPLPLVSAVLPGEREDEVLVVAHLCHPKPSANDNGSGVASALEALRALVALRAQGAFPAARARSVRFLWMPELTGTFAWLGADPARADRIVAALNLDMTGADQEAVGATFLLEHPPCFAASFAEELLARVRAEAVDWVESYSGPGWVPRTRLAEVPYSGGSDHAVFVDPAIGVPCPLLIQWPDRYYHSSLDTPDRCDPRSLALSARCAAAYAGALALAGAEEARGLLSLCARGARARLLAAADSREPTRLLARERMRATCAFASFGRLGLAEAELVDAIRALGEFVSRERLPVAPAAPAEGPAREPGMDRRPRRVTGAPLDMFRHCLPGWSALTREERERWRADDAATPGGSVTQELAWYAADGERTLAQIALMVWLESGVHAPAAIATFFDWTARLGLARWEA
jgi:aminopeptidase YwaD